MATLFTKQSMALQTAYAELKRQALEQLELLIGTPGSVVERTTAGRRFLYRDYYAPTGKKAGDYLGPRGDPAAESRASAVREQIVLANGLIAEAALLVQNGYVRVEPRTNAILAALANNRLFHAGAVLIGSHSYGALLNDLGARAAATGTEDVDVARGRRLAITKDAKSFEEMLGDSRVPLHPVPQLDRRSPSTSFKPPGHDRLRVDLLMPTDGDEVKILSAPELHAHATGLPWLRYLVENPLPGVVIGKSAMVPVNLPRPERLAWHKMLVSQLRSETSEKAAKDIEQAATLVAILAETSPESLLTAFKSVPRGAREKTRRGARRALARLKATTHHEAAELLGEVSGQ
jgi:hypothetical protein